MKRFLLPLLLCLPFLSNAQQPAMQAWKPLLNNAGLAAYFNGTFNYLGVYIAETGEKLTVHHLGSSFELSPGIDSARADFVITLHTEDVTNMVELGGDNKIDEAESFRIVRAIFTPITERELNNKFLTQKKYLKAAHVGEVIHVTLLNPDPKEKNYAHTLIYSNKQWIAAPGLLGKPASSLKLTPAQAIEFQRNLFIAHQANTQKAWLKFAKWYNTWKKTVTVA